MKKPQIKKLDLIWSKKIKEFDGCEVCLNKNGLNAHHIIGRRNYTLRWDIRNGVVLCPKHHTLGNESAHQDPLWFDKWLRDNRLEDYEYLQEQRNKVLKRTYEEVINQLNETNH